MDEPTSKVIVAAIGLVQSVLWPALLLWFLYRFRTQVEELIKRLQTAKGPGMELIFNRVEHSPLHAAHYAALMRPTWTGYSP